MQVRLVTSLLFAQLFEHSPVQVSVGVCVVVQGGENAVVGAQVGVAKCGGFHEEHRCPDRSGLQGFGQRPAVMQNMVPLKLLRIHSPRLLANS
jgi:hypothetical protein